MFLLPHLPKITVRYINLLLPVLGVISFIAVMIKEFGVIIILILLFLPLFFCVRVVVSLFSFHMVLLVCVN